MIATTNSGLMTNAENAISDSDRSPLTFGELKTKFDLPETPFIKQAFGYARDRMSATLFNHVARSWIFAVKLGVMKQMSYDAEVVAASVLLHDMGLTEHADGPNRFEVNGAGAARAFVCDHGFDGRRAQLVWDSIALHTTPSIGIFKETEVALCARGIGVDFGTPDYAEFQKTDIDAIVAAAPRLGLKKTFTACFCHLAKTKPETTYDSIVREFGERYVPGYKAPSMVDLINAGPFDE
jgi:hypothetical protein